jgi:hypothetical protein
MLDDHKVPWLGAEKIEHFALEWRKLEGNHNAPTFDILAFLNHRLPHLLVGKAMEIIPRDDSEFAEPALVKFYLEKEYGYQRAELHIKRWVLDQAKFGDEEARLIIAHEIGHLILHDASAPRFSPGADKNLKFLQNEESAEWQAKRFADAFLVPLHVAASFLRAEELATYCHVGLDCARRRLLAVCSVALEQKSYSGNSCGNCGAYRMKSFGMSNFCEECGKRTLFL